MGADIHLWVERSTRDTGFEAIVPSRSNIACALANVHDPAGWVRWMLSIRSLQWYVPRNYFDFALLDGRREAWPFAPLIPARGFPKNLSDEVVRSFQEAGLPDPRTATTGDLDREDVQSASWFTLAEAMAVDWTMSVPCQRGVFYRDAERPQAGVVEDLEELAAVVAATGCYPSMWRGRPIGVTEPEPVPSQGVWDGYLATSEPVSSVAQVLRALMQQMSDVRADPTELRAVYSFDQLFGFRQPPL